MWTIPFYLKRGSNDGNNNCYAKFVLEYCYCLTLNDRHTRIHSNVPILLQQIMCVCVHFFSEYGVNKRGSISLIKSLSFERKWLKTSSSCNLFWRTTYWIRHFLKTLLRSIFSSHYCECYIQCAISLIVRMPAATHSPMAKPNPISIVYVNVYWFWSLMCTPDAK